MADWSSLFQRLSSNNTNNPKPKSDIPTMKKYRKKPVIIDAVRFDPSGSNRNNIARLPNVVAEPDGTLSIITLEGVMTAYPGDWIIRGIQGEIYPCKHDIFEATYEPANHPSR
jgi:hypothetical protein